MDETKLTATLPYLTMEIIRRELPEDKVDILTIHVRASPGFQTAGSLLAWPLLAWPLDAWATLMRAAWFIPYRSGYASLRPHWRHDL